MGALPYTVPETIRAGADAKQTYQYISLLNQINCLVQLEALKQFLFDSPNESSNLQFPGQRSYTDVFDGVCHLPRQKDTTYFSLS